MSSVRLYALDKSVTPWEYKPVNMVNGSMYVRQVASDVIPPENTLYSEGVSAITAAAAMTTSDISAYSHAVVVISGLTGETIAITGLVLGAIYSGNIKSTTTAGVDAAAATLGNGTFYLKDLCFSALKFTKSAAVEAVTISITFKS